MLILKTILKESKNRGIGLFAGEYIPKGTTIWINDKHTVIEFTSEYIESLPEIPKQFFDKYAWTEDGKIFKVNLDNERFINHSETPNVYYDKINGNMISSIDIYEDEEIVCDYRTFDLDSYKNLGFEIF